MTLSTFSASDCSANSIAYPSIFGTQILNLSAELVSNYSYVVPEQYAYNFPSTTLEDVTYCNVTITYTHPGQNDIINTEIWAPIDPAWNGRMQGVGGGGYIAGRFFLSYEFMKIGVANGYVGVTTDAGIPTDPTNQYQQDWAQISPGNVDLYALQNFGSVSLNESAYMGKSIIKSLYGRPPTYSYFTGCSGGGRQGLMLAQRYPEAYDGIAASAPAINWSEFIVGGYWPQLQMNLHGQYPRSCELNQVLAASIRACDPLDGVVDGLISDVDSCAFDPFSVVGTSFNCTDTGLEMEISRAAAIIMNATWTGAHTPDGSFLWYGPLRGANVTGGISTIVDTTCTNSGTCAGKPNYLATNWMQGWLKRDLNANLTTLSLEDYTRLFKDGVEYFQSLIETNNPDLSLFKARGGKLLGYHGLADTIIQPFGSRHYYDRITALDADVHDFYRTFEAPGLAHCYGGPGAYPSGTFGALVAWVENGTLPDVLVGYLPANATGFRGERKLCPYPQKSKYDGTGNVDSTNSYTCV